MDSNEIFDIVELIGATPSTNGKLAILKEVDSEDFEYVLKLAYSPFITFGVKEVVPEEPGESEFDDDTWALLDKLATRRLTGHSALHAISEELFKLSEDSGDLLRRILKKDLRMGVDAKTINKATPGLIPLVCYMRCSLVKHIDPEAIKWDKCHFSQIKADGSFANITYDKTISITTRIGHEYPHMPFFDLLVDVEYYFKKGYQYHGELLVARHGKVLPRKEGNGILNSVRLGGTFGIAERPLYRVWDMVPVESLATRVCHTPYNDRFRTLETFANTCNTGLIETRLVQSWEEALQHYKDARAAGEEGTILKLNNAIWKDGTSKEQIKFKNESVCELEVVGLNPGTGKFEGQVGSLRCATADLKLFVNVNLREEAQRASVDESWIGKIVSVIFESVTTNAKGQYSLFLPRLDEVRHDKYDADTLDYVLNL